MTGNVTMKFLLLYQSLQWISDCGRGKCKLQVHHSTSIIAWHYTLACNPIVFHSSSASWPQPHLCVCEQPLVACNNNASRHEDTEGQHHEYAVRNLGGVSHMHGQVGIISHQGGGAACIACTYTTLSQHDIAQPWRPLQRVW